MWGSGAAIDQYNRRLDKALSASDRTHELKVNYVYNLPIGHGQKWLKHGFLSQAIGGWRLGAVQAFNVLNRTIFGTPNTNMSDIANFGLVRTQANVARRMQFALKLNW